MVGEIFPLGNDSDYYFDLWIVLCGGLEGAVTGVVLSRRKGLDPQRVVTHLDLMSGIGGFALAAKMVGGIKTVGFCELDPWARKVLLKNFPGVPIHDDVRTLNCKEYEKIDLITAGYPCQPFSIAGKREGAKDDRHLWPHLLTIVARARPRMLLCENVAGHVSLGLDQVLFDLAREGYSATPVVIPACAVGADHRRDRVWIMGYSKHAGSLTATVEAIFDQACDNRKEGPFQAWQSPGTGRPGDDGDVAHANSIDRRSGARRQNRAKTGNSGEAASNPNGQHENHAGYGAGEILGERSETPFLLRSEADWIAESGMGRVAHGIPKRVDRLRGLGNAIVPQVAAEILRCMIRAASLYEVRCD